MRAALLTKLSDSGPRSTCDQMASIAAVMSSRQSASWQLTVR